MKRDMELIRELLLFFEEKETREFKKTPRIHDYDDGLIRYHLLLLHEAGYLRCEVTKSSTSDRVVDVLPQELTWDGHEFLDRIRDRFIWDEVVGNMKEHGLTSASVELLKQIADRILRKKIGLD
ncbi:MAG: DUF2513 domain-containing protein [Pirellulales bacterium]|nr:DUF2513 domain-containing protein [Pirellulales bacterium]